MNLTIVSGNLGANPEVRTTKSGTTVCNISLATNERVKQGDIWVDHTEWHRIVVFGGQAESCAKYLTKVSSVNVVGKLRTREYQDKDGNKRKSTEILADRVEFTSRASSRPPANQPPTNGAPTYNNDEIPF